MNCLLISLKQCFHHFIVSKWYFLGVYTFIWQQMNTTSFEAWNFCRHNHWYHDQADSCISDIVAMEKKNDITIHDHIKTRWISMFNKNIATSKQRKKKKIIQSQKFCQKKKTKAVAHSYINITLIYCMIAVADVSTLHASFIEILTFSYARAVRKDYIFI